MMSSEDCKALIKEVFHEKVFILKNRILKVDTQKSRKMIIFQTKLNHICSKRQDTRDIKTNMIFFIHIVLSVSCVKGVRVHKSMCFIAGCFNILCLT